MLSNVPNRKIGTKHGILAFTLKDRKYHAYKNLHLLPIDNTDNIKFNDPFITKTHSLRLGKPMPIHEQIFLQSKYCSKLATASTLPPQTKR